LKLNLTVPPKKRRKPAKRQARIRKKLINGKRTVGQIRKSEERFRLLVKNAFDFITVFSEDGTIIFETDSVERILGYKPEERIGKNIFKQSIVHPDDLEQEKESVSIAKLKPGENIRTELRFRHKNGEYKMLDTVTTNLLHEPAVKGFVANHHDITEEKKLEYQREEFVSIASHELKTPLTTMKGYIEILHDLFTTTNNQLANDLVDKLSGQMERMLSLVTDMLDVTKIREGQLQLNKTHFSIDQLILQVVNEIQVTCKEHRIVSELNVEKNILADRERIGQVLSNLISNAIKYSPGGEKIIITSKSSEHAVAICVQDFGIGISENMQEKVFDRFFRVTDDPMKNFPGIGLGLYITADIIKRHRGKISVKSEKNKGSVFCFTIPSGN
jgi:PAS domain S-box-containing protein